MKEMTSWERFSRMYAHKEADRVPIIDAPWGTTIQRWQNEGMPKGMDFRDYFGLDKVAGFSMDNSPRFPAKVVEETEAYRTYTTSWGATLRNWKHATSTPEFLDFTIKDRESWKIAKERMLSGDGRINWESLKKNYPVWKESGQWTQLGFWFGFDVTHSWAVGTERVLIAMLEDPEWCSDMFNTWLDVDIALAEQILAAGYTFDCISWPDDMGYKLNQFFSLQTYRELLKPVHKRAIDWAHSKGMKTHLHSCGDIRPLVPELVESGLDALNPIEVKAGMDPLKLKNQYGKDLVFHGGINAVLWGDLEAILAEIRNVVPVMKQSGGYIFSSDHSVPDSVSLENFREITRLAKETGSC
ncbi:MAG TPA: hypothetical protein DD727_01570 [Clostridiales bacterium]|nr:hypothetical protein [Clostridiales bacterium]